MYSPINHSFRITTQKEIILEFIKWELGNNVTETWMFLPFNNKGCSLPYSTYVQ